MQEMPWLNTHLGSIDDAIALIRRYTWDIRIIESSGRWYVQDGPQTVIFVADSKEVVDVFLYGLGLAYACLPEHLSGKLERELKQWYKEHLGAIPPDEKIPPK